VQVGVQTSLGGEKAPCHTQTPSVCEWSQWALGTRRVLHASAASIHTMAHTIFDLN
jgi:hypothetical protein